MHEDVRLSLVYIHGEMQARACLCMRIHETQHGPAGVQHCLSLTRVEVATDSAMRDLQPHSVLGRVLYLKPHKQRKPHGDGLVNLVSSRQSLSRQCQDEAMGGTGETL